MKHLTGLLLSMSLALAPAAHAMTYVGKVQSYATGGLLRNRVVIYPTNEEGVAAGTLTCRSLTRGVRCLARRTPVAVTFYTDNTVEVVMGGGACVAVGVGSPFGGPLSGYYECFNGDEGAFYFDRVR
jgi:hypothetical protein